MVNQLSTNTRSLPPGTHPDHHNDIHTVINEMSGGTTGQILQKASGSNHDFTWGSPSAVPDATSGVKGVVQLAGDLSGTATAPTVPGLTNKADKTAVWFPLTFSNTGNVAVGAGKSRLRLPPSPTSGWTLASVTAAVNTAPTGASLIVDVNKNGTTIYGTQGNRPTIAASGFGVTVAAGQASVTTFTADGDYLTVDVDQIGSTVTGADLTVTVWLRAT